MSDDAACHCSKRRVWYRRSSRLPLSMSHVKAVANIAGLWVQCPVSTAARDVSRASTLPATIAALTSTAQSWTEAPR